MYIQQSKSQFVSIQTNHQSSHLLDCVLVNFQSWIWWFLWMTLPTPSHRALEQHGDPALVGKIGASMGFHKCWVSSSFSSNIVIIILKIVIMIISIINIVVIIIIINIMIIKIITIVYNNHSHDSPTSRYNIIIQAPKNKKTNHPSESNSKSQINLRGVQATIHLRNGASGAEENSPRPLSLHLPAINGSFSPYEFASKIGKNWDVFWTPRKIKFVTLKPSMKGESICKCVYNTYYVCTCNVYMFIYIYSIYVYVCDHVPGGGKEVQDIWLARNLIVDWKTSIQIAPLMYTKILRFCWDGEWFTRDIYPVNWLIESHFFH